MNTPERNPYINGMGVPGALAGVVWLILGVIGAMEAGEPYGVNLAVVAGFNAWAAIFGAISLALCVGALVVAGATWHPAASAEAGNETASDSTEAER